MSEVNDPTIEVLSNVDLDLAGTEMRPPLIDKRQVKSIITACYWTPHKDGSGQVKLSDKGEKMKQFVVHLKTIEQAVSTTGKTIEPGYTCKVVINGTPTGGRTQLMINQQIGRVVMAAEKLDDEKQLGKVIPEALVGKVVNATYEVEMGRKQNSDGTWSDDPEKLYQRVSRWEKVS